MHFRIIEQYGRFWPQIYKKLWNGVTWGDGWEDIGSGKGYETIVDAKQMCLKYKNKNKPEVVDEFNL